MDDTVNRLAKELAQAIRAAVAADPTVEACRAKARAAGYEMHLSIDAEVGFANRAKPNALVKVRRAGAGAVSAAQGAVSQGSGTQSTQPASPVGFTPTVPNAGAVPASGAPAAGASSMSGSNGILPRRSSMRELSASDRLFLKSLRIAPDELPEVKG